MSPLVKSLKWKSPFILTGERGPHFSLGTAGLRELRDGALVEGKGWEKRTFCFPSPTCLDICRLSWAGDAASGLDTYIYGPDTGGAFRTACSGHSLLQLSGLTLETIYSPKAPGTSGSVTLVTLKSPWGLAILENIFN